eukprot:8179949-Ditylum_brightwellii.AAC.1
MEGETQQRTTRAFDMFPPPVPQIHLISLDVDMVKSVISANHIGTGGVNRVIQDLDAGTSSIAHL